MLRTFIEYRVSQYRLTLKSSKDIQIESIDHNRVMFISISLHSYVEVT